MAYWQAPLALAPMPARVRGGNWGHKCGLLPQSVLNSYNATGHGGVPLGLWLALIGSFLRSQVALPVWRMLTSVFFHPCTLVKSHTKAREHDTESMACLIGSKFGVTGRSSRMAFHVVPPVPSLYSFEVATYERGTPQRQYFDPSQPVPNR